MIDDEMLEVVDAYQYNCIGPMLIQDMYRGTKTRVKTRCGRTEYFEVKVGLHQGSALSPLLFIIIMDVLAEEARTKPTWAMLFADDLVLVSKTAEEVEE